MGSGDVWFFDRIAPLYDLVMPPPDPDALHRALGDADRAVTRVLDVGGGTGRGIRELDVAERLVLDAAPGMLDRVPPGIHRLHASATAIPLRNATVDAITIIDALHHLPKPESVLAESYRVLRPGGVLVVRDFNPTTLRGRLVALGERLLGFKSTFTTPEALKRQLATTGFHAQIHDHGFAYTLTGTKPHHQ